ncbi:hypothetical protein PEDI_17720 [Persicobacter diffluens]|uniref:Uncharacterized protein n=1 Tax=Persicobacter diffluens TaxID=981 RepID=A0AAN4VZI5_9BACT|nr:hypothetical protein PEDI_17720 [Persicobacter diffluens]
MYCFLSVYFRFFYYCFIVHNRSIGLLAEIYWWFSGIVIRIHVWHLCSALGRGLKAPDDEFLRYINRRSVRMGMISTSVIKAFVLSNKPDTLPDSSEQNDLLVF